MLPSWLIAKLDTLLSELQQKSNRLRNESQAITKQWTALGRMGAQREDYAANLLKNISSTLKDIALFCSTCDEQIAHMLAFPFAEDEESNSDPAPIDLKALEADCNT